MIYTRKDLSNFDNLYLAWKRIQTSTRPEYKEICNDLYSAFGWHLQRKLSLFASEIENNIYNPIYSSKFYQPKKSGLVRPITVLSIKDQLFYQAITNLICEGKYEDLRKFRRGTVFGGFNIQSPKSIHFLSLWKEEYRNYKRSIKSNFEKDYIWLCKFDLASFYDTIDHKILIENICSDIFDDDLKFLLLQALNIWSKPQSLKLPYSQGIPQGPCASQVIADLYLNYLDEKVKEISIRHGFKYLRYVDDIVLMGQEAKDVKIGLIKLDIIARELALVPQSGKIEIKQIENIEDELKGENSLIEFISSSEATDDITKQKYLRKLLFKSIKLNQNGETEVIDETGFKFAAYRLKPDLDLLELILDVLKNYLHLATVCMIYLNKMEYTKETDEHIYELLRDQPIHDWYTAQLLNYKHISSSKYLEQICNLGVSTIESPERHWFLKEKFLSILNHHPEYEFLFTNTLKKKIPSEILLESQLPYYLSLLRESYKISPSLTNKVLKEVRSFARQVFDEFYLLLGYLHQRDNQHSTSEAFNEWFSSNLIQYDTSIAFSKKDGIMHHLVRFYEIEIEDSNAASFKSLLSDEYELALKYICDSIGFYENDPERYVLMTDTFNQIILSSILKDEKKISKYDLDNMIGKFQSRVQGSCYGMRKCHALRAKSSMVHAYDKWQETANKESRTKWFRNAIDLKKELSISYKYLISHVQSLS